MKTMTKRLTAMLIAVILVVGLIPATSLTVQAASYKYNWGVREKDATYLSQDAISFYAKYNTSYEELSSLSGSSSTGSVPSSALYKRLQSLMKGAHSYQTSYGATKSMYQYTDCQNGGGKISSFYSGKAVGPSWDGSFNREHTWPNSKGLGGADENDIMMLRPTSYAENSSRGNTAYGNPAAIIIPTAKAAATTTFGAMWPGSHCIHMFAGATPAECGAVTA